MEIENLRKEIDEIDLSLASLFEKRLDLAKKIGKYKKENNLPITFSEREKQVSDNITNNIKPEYEREAQLFAAGLISAGKSVQRKL